jgi:hypothetical protein
MYFGQRFHTPNETSKECIQFLIISCDYFNLSFANEYVSRHNTNPGYQV